EHVVDDVDRHPVEAEDERRHHDQTNDDDNCRVEDLLARRPRDLLHLAANFGEILARTDPFGLRTGRAATFRRGGTTRLRVHPLTRHLSLGLWVHSGCLTVRPGW